MSAIEFIAQAGKTFSVQLYNATTGATIGAAITPVTDSVPTRYRASTGSTAGVVYVVATATNLRVAGYADLDDPETSGYSPLRDTFNAQEAMANFAILPLTLEQRLRTAGYNIYAKTEETSLVGFGVLPDANGDVPDLNALTLSLKFVSRSGAVVTIASGNITVNTEGNFFSFHLPAECTEAPSEWQWSLRASEQSAHLAGGLLSVSYAP